MPDHSGKRALKQLIFASSSTTPQKPKQKTSETQSTPKAFHFYWKPSTGQELRARSRGGEQASAEALHLTDGQAYGFIQVARESEVVPELKLAIQEGELSVSQSRRITSVLTPENQAEWIEKAKHLTQRELEREVATVNPKPVIQEKIRPVAEKLSQLRCGITPELEKKLRRVQDLESKRLKKTVSLEEALTALVDTYLERKDPVKRAERLSSRIKVKKVLPQEQRIPLPAHLKHEVNLRDRGQCVYRNKKGIRCNQTPWTELHHKIPLSQGGPNSVDNLITLCSTHHRFLHGNG